MSNININKVSVEFGDWATPRYDGEYPRISSGLLNWNSIHYLLKYHT